MCEDRISSDEKVKRQVLNLEDFTKIKDLQNACLWEKSHFLTSHFHWI